MNVEDKVHKAARSEDSTPGRARCAVCGQRIHKVPGGQGPVWVHSGSNAVAASNPAQALLDLHGRTERAAQTLAEIARDSSEFPTEVARLRAKREGVLLALSYIEEALR